MSVFEQLSEALEEERPVAVATVISEVGLGNKILVHPGGERVGSLGTGELDRLATEEVLDAFAERRTGPVEVETGAGETVELFVEVFPPPEKLIIVGAVHVAIHLVTLAQPLGLRTIVVDARTAFATEERFPHADELVVGWPADVLLQMHLNEGTYVVFLTHDPKLDNPALEVVLGRPVRYVGALGSTRTHAKRVAALREMGLDDDAIGRIHAPIGLDLGGRKPEEIAVSILAQIVQARHGRA